MCLIIHKPTTERVSWALFNNAYIRNSDGWGIMFSDGQDVHVYKGNTLISLYETYLIHQDKELYIHMRYATHGVVSINNTHPMHVVDGIYVMHNGIIPNMEYYAEDNESDTVAFVNYLRPILQDNPNILWEPLFQHMISMSMGDSRFLFLFPDGRHLIITDSKWITWQGLSLSNTYAWDLWKQYLPKTETKALPPATSSHYDITMADLLCCQAKELYKICDYYPEEVANAILQYRLDNEYDSTDDIFLSATHG